MMEDVVTQEALQKGMGFAQFQCIANILSIYWHTCAYVICLLNIGYIIIMSKLSKHANAPAECHYLAVKCLFCYLYQKS